MAGVAAARGRRSLWQHRRMSQTFGSEAPPPHRHTAHRPRAHYLVVIDSGGVRLARLLLASREQTAEIDAGTEEVAQMIVGLTPSKGADGIEWDRALQGHSHAERRAAEVYTLDV